MRWVGLVLGVVVVLTGAIILAVPDLLPAVGRLAVTPGGLYAIAALRITLGLAVVLAATSSRAPRTLRALGVFVIIAGLTTPAFGVARSRAVLEWWTSTGPAFTRLFAGVLMVMGGFLVYAFLPSAPTGER